MNTTYNGTTLTITDKTALGELLSILNLGEKPHDTPTPKMLRETVGAPIATDDFCTVYANGFAVYDNGSGRTVLWLPSCVSFTYRFNPMKDSEKGGDIRETCTLPEGMLESQPWSVAVTLIGEHRIEANSMNRQGSRTGTKDYAADDNADKDGDTENAVEQAYRSEYTWSDGWYGEDPLQKILRKERRREMLEAMTDKQREVFIMYYREGYTQQEIADILDLPRSTIGDRLNRALSRVKKIFYETRQNASSHDSI